MEIKMDAEAAEEYRKIEDKVKQLQAENEKLRAELKAAVEQALKGESDE